MPVQAAKALASLHLFVVPCTDRLDRPIYYGGVNFPVISCMDSCTIVSSISFRTAGYVSAIMRRVLEYGTALF